MANPYEFVSGKGHLKITFYLVNARTGTAIRKWSFNKVPRQLSWNWGDAPGQDPAEFLRVKPRKDRITLDIDLQGDSFADSFRGRVSLPYHSNRAALDRAH